MIATILPWLVLAATPVIVDENLTWMDVSQAADFLPDPAAAFRFSDVKSRADGWSSMPPPGNPTGALWVRLSFSTTSSNDQLVWLQTGGQYTEHATLFAPDGKELNAGQRVALGPDVIPARSPTFPLRIPSGNATTVIARLAGEQLIDPSLSVGSPQAITQRNVRATLISATAYGLLLIMGLYNLALALFLRQRGHLFYAAYTLLMLVWLTAMCGDLRLALPTLVPVASHALVHITILAAQLLAIGFCRDLLATRTTMPRADLWMRILFVVIAADLLFGLLLPWALVAVAVTLLVPLLYLTFAVVGVVRVVQGYHPARYYALAWVLLFGVLLVGALSANGVLPAWILEQAMHLGLALDVTALSLALADRAKLQTEHIQQMHDASGRFVPYEFLAILGRKELPEVAHGDQIERDMTVYFSDVRSFTTLVEGMTPQQTIRFVNDYLAAMEPSITSQRGFIDKYIGDAVMALFENADDAVAGALEGLRALERYNATRASSGQQPIAIGIGLHTGRLMLGTVGSARRVSCTVLGDSVNLASRVEGLTKQYGAALLITDATRAALQRPERVQLRQVDRVAAKGKTEPVTLYEVLDGQPEEIRRRRMETRETFEAGCAKFVAGDAAGAREQFQKCAERDPSDVAVALYLKRCKRFLTEGVPEGWDGVVRMETK